MSAIALTGIDLGPFLFPEQDPQPVLAATPPAGLLDDFAYSQHQLPDAAITEIRGDYSFSDNVAWERPWVGVSRPRTNYFSRGTGSISDKVFWRQADYAEISGRWEAVPDGRSHYFDSVMFEEADVHLNQLSGSASNFEGQWYDYVSGGDGGITYQLYFRTYWWETVLPDAPWSGLRTGELFWPVAYPGTDMTISPVRAGGGMTRAVEGQQWVGSIRYWISHGLPSDEEVRTTLAFYDADFVEIYREQPAYTALDSSSRGWVQLSVTSVAPANTKWVAVLPEIDGDTVPNYNAQIFVDDFVLRNVSSDPNDYEDPRKQMITVVATRVNDIVDPQPTNALSNYTATYGDTLVASDGINPVDGVTGGLVLDSGATGSYVGVTSWTENATPDRQLMGELQVGVPYVFSAWVRKIQDLDIRISLYGQFGQNYQLNSASYDEVVASGDPTDDSVFRTDASSRQWVRLHVPFTLAPYGVDTGVDPGTGELRVVNFEITVDTGDTIPSGPVFGSVAYQLEKGSLPTSYFDGSFGADYMWEESADWSRSHHYENFLMGSNRIEEIVAEYIPFGVPFEVQYAQPDNGQRQLLDAYGRPLGEAFG
jgi:hypothetical protein